MPLGRRRRTFQGTGTLAAPVNTGLPSIAGLPGVGVQLSCFFGVWTGFPAPTYGYQWKRDGVTDIGTNSPFYTQLLADEGALITCVVTGTNSQGSASATSNAIGPVVQLPANISAPVATATAVVGQTATVAVGSWNNALSYLYQWFENGALVPGATLTTFLLSTAGATVYCRVTSTNTGGSASANSNTIGPVGLAPQNTVLPALSGGGAAGQAISLSTGTFVGYPASYTYTRRYYADGVLIAGQSGATFTPSHLHAGKVITGSVVATNSTGSSVEVFTSNSVGPITSPPVFETDPVLSGNGTVGQVLTVSTLGLYAYPAASLSYIWYADALVIAGAASATHQLTAAQEGDIVSAQVTAANVHGSDVATTNNISVAAAEPTPGQWDLVTENNIILTDETGDKLVTEEYSGLVLSGLTLTPLAGGTTARASVNSTTTVGLLCAIVTRDTVPEPQDGDIEDWALNGHPDVVWRTSFELSAITDGDPGISGLTQETGYRFSAVVRLTSAVGDYSNVLSGTFTTLDAFPVLSSPIVTAKSPTTAIGSWLTTDQTGSTKWGVWLVSATPSDDDVIAGTGAVVSGSKTNTAAGRVSLANITGLSAGALYRFHAIQIDASTNRSNKITYDFATPAVQTTVFQFANAGVTTGLSFNNVTGTGAQTDPLGGANAVKAERDPAGVSTTCSVSRSFNVGVTQFEVQFTVKKLAWASSEAWLRWRAQNVDYSPLMHVNLDTAELAGVDVQITGAVAVPLEDGYIFVKLGNVDIRDASPPYDTDGSFFIYLCRSATTASIQTSGNHAIALYDYKIVTH